MITMYTIGFTKKSAKHFFELLINNKVEKVIDIRINNSSQLAGFAKGNDLSYFVHALGNMGYIHNTDFAPTKELLTGYQKGEISWPKYIEIFRGLLIDRKISQKYNIESFNNACFLCTEDTPEQCHRRLLVEYFKELYPDKIRIIHLVK